MTNASRGRLARLVGNRAMPRPVPSRQRGQAMVFSLAFGVATTLVALVLFNSGILANTKTRLQNAADAGAYSAAVLQARDHNFSALTNRAMVANQAAVAQIVSMKSYLEDAAETHDRMDGYLRIYSEIYPANKPLWDTALNVPMGNISSGFNAIAPTLTRSLDRLIQGYQNAQEGHHTATAAAMIAAANEVVRRNDPQAEVTSGTFRLARTTVQVTGWKDYTRQHAANDNSAQADRFADVVVSNQTTDPFTRSRRPWFPPSAPRAKWSSEVKFCQVLPNYVWSNTTFAFVQNGGSMLSTDKRTWLALDATMGGGSWFCTFWYPCFTGICYSTIANAPPHIDLGGSGGGRAGNGGYNSMSGYRNNPSDSNMFGRGVWSLPGILRYADGPGNTLDSAGGLQSYYRDVADTTSTPENQSAGLNASPAVTFEVERTGSTVRTSSAFLTGSDRLNLENAMQGDTMRVVSSAQSYFYRPRQNSGAFTRNSWQRGDNRAEMANLFSPYWQSRLVERSLADRAASWGAQ